MHIPVEPGDLLACRSDGTGGRLIRLGAAIKDAVTGKAEPNLSNHIAIVHHRDAHGTLWALEGRPGGVGWADAKHYLQSPWTISNAGQPKTDKQRELVTSGALKLLGSPYDWAAIADDALNAFGINMPGWNPQFGKVPGHVVCSSLAAYVYAKAGLEHPDGERNVSPADWLALIFLHHWEG